MIRFFDFLFSLLGLIILSPLLILLWIAGLFENGSPLYKQQRIGYNQKLFFLIKFRTMPMGTKSAATHLIDNSIVTTFGIFLRRTKFDEIPQLWNVLKGEMSLVGPRPCLLNQKKLINERKKRGVFQIKPGITGLSQIKGITMKHPTLLAKTDLEMIKQLNVFNYFYYIGATMLFIFKK
jgi:O-antigen biosynthesis protein WbqP